LKNLVLSTEIKYEIPFKSMDYINLFGKLNIDDILELHKEGKIENQDIIKVIDKMPGDIEFLEYVKTLDEIFEFYDADRFEEMIQSGKLNEKFVENYNKLTFDFLQEMSRKLHFEELIGALKTKENGTELIITLLQKGMNIPKGLELGESKLDTDTIEDMFLNDQMSEEDILKLHKLNLIDIKFVKEVFKDSPRIEKYYEDGKLPLESLNILDKNKTVEVLKKQLIDGKIGVPEILKLYSDEDGIGIDEFVEIDRFMQENGKNMIVENMSDYLLNNILPEKVQALFNKQYISPDDLSLLIGRGVITEEQAKTYADELSTDKKYEELFNEHEGIIELTTRELPAEEIGKRNEGNKRKNPRANKVKNDPELQKKLLDTIGFDKRVLVLKGEQNSLAGYKVYLSKKLKTMVFINEENVGNATYITSLEQGMFLVNNIKRNNGLKIAQQLQSAVTKSSLRETPHVKVKNAAKGWGANVVDSMIELNPTLENELKPNCKYNEKINGIIEEIREDYEIRK